MQTSPPWMTVDRFSPQAKALRTHFEKQFKDPRKTTAERFVWDYWHVPNQYTLIRTPAYEYFPKATYKKFHEQLVKWGRDVLGCHDVSPPWLSYYVDGCLQELHADVPHGPWAFVYSLTPWETRKFLGGETLLLKDKNSIDLKASFVEHEELMEAIEPKFNRLSVFDPSIPHGVKPVRGVWDPLQARLVVHGWFINPRPYIDGPLHETELQEKLDELSAWMSEQTIEVQGWMSLRFKVQAGGSTSKPVCLFNRLQGKKAEVDAWTDELAELIQSWKWTKQRKISTITLPLQIT